MVCVIAVCMPFGECTIRFNDWNNRIVFTLLWDERYDGRRSATYGAACSSLPSISSWMIPLLEMYVGIDTTRGDECAVTVQSRCIRSCILRQVASDTENYPIFNANVLSNDAIRCIDLPNVD